MAKFPNLAVGDHMVRIHVGAGSMNVVVVAIDDSTITVDQIQDDGTIFPGNWQFDINTAIEINDEKHWGPAYGITGSYLEMPQ